MTSSDIIEKINRHRDELETAAESGLNTAYVAGALLDIADEEADQ
jgi:hypothetical protein